MRAVVGIEQQDEVVTANVADKLFAVIDKAAQAARQTQQNLITSGVTEVIDQGISLFCLHAKSPHPIRPKRLCC